MSGVVHCLLELDTDPITHGIHGKQVKLKCSILTDQVIKEVIWYDRSIFISFFNLGVAIIKLLQLLSYLLIVLLLSKHAEHMIHGFMSWRYRSVVGSPTRLLFLSNTHVFELLQGVVVWII